MDTNFKEVLKELAMVWHENNAPIIDNLAPGIDISYEDILSFTGKLPEEVKELYQWRNGIHSSRQDQLIGTLKLFELGIFMPLDKVRSFQQQMADDEFGWDASQLPLFESGGGDFFLIECDDTLGSYGRIYLQSAGAVEFDKIISIYDSLYTLFLGVLENTQKGNYTYNAQGMLDVNYDRSHQVMKKLNPVSAYWKLF